MSITAAALALSTGVAFAQMAPSPGGAPGSTGLAGPPASAAPRAPAVNPLTMEDVSHITGTAVYGSDDKKIGSISNVLMKPDSKTIDRFVVAEGGLLGVGAHHVALPLDQFRWDQQKEGFTLAKTAAELKAMAEWQDPSRITSGSGSSAPPPSLQPSSGGAAVPPAH
jgi:sporulation protein YlmC with PRC-barrel domain